MTKEWPTENSAREPRSLPRLRSQKEYKLTAENLTEDANEQYRLQNTRGQRQREAPGRGARLLDDGGSSC